MKRPIIIIGAGGHSKVVLDTLQDMGEEIVGLVDNAKIEAGVSIQGYLVIGDDQTIESYATNSIFLVNGVGSIRDTVNRKQVYVKFTFHGYEFASVIHPTAIISKHAELGNGVQIMAGSVIQAEAHLGRNVIVNTGATVDHNCQIGDHCHIAPGAVLSGNVDIGEDVHVGTGASIIQEVKIGAGATVAAGATVIADVAAGTLVAGVPAREVRR